jgi:hypothetical protein
MNFTQIPMLIGSIGLLLTGLININEISKQVYVAPPLRQDEIVRFVVTGDSRGIDADPGVNTTILAEIAQATINERGGFYSNSG